MKIAIGCDPNATEMKNTIKAYVESLGHECTDFGSDDPIYANTAIALAEAVAAKKYDRGILICGTGIGVAIAANKVKGAYAATVNNCYQAQRAELSNHANIITMGERVIGVEHAKKVLEAFLDAKEFQTKSQRKVDRMRELEAESFGKK